MAEKWDMDWDERIFVLKAGIVELDVKVDLYSAWKEELIANPSYMQYAPAMRSVGGDPISDTQDLGSTYFLINGYRIRPHEASHELIVDGNIYTDPAGDSVFVPTLGTYTVLVTNRVSNLVDSSVARLDLAQLLDGIYIDVDNGEAGTAEGIGTPTRPVNNITDARTIADNENLRSYVIVSSDITLTADHVNWNFEATGNSSLTLSNCDVSGSQFRCLTITGTALSPTESIIVEEAQIENYTNFLGDASRSLLYGTITLTAGNSSFNACASEIPGPGGRPIIDMVGAGRHVGVRQYSGGIQINNSVAGNNISVDLVSGTVVVDSSCTGGTMVVRGVGKLIDNSSGAVSIDVSGFVEADDVRLTRKITQNKLVTNRTSGELEIFDDDGSALISAPIYEDADGTQPYRGQGVERRERLE